MAQQYPKVSIVIPVYNERQHLEACLEAIASLSLKPSEVIVVDNNSIDGTAEMAASYPWVTVIKERRQGVVHARRRGFNAASSPIIARIDADTLLPSDWLNRIIANFEADPDLAAVSGSANYYDFFFIAPIARALDVMTRRFLANRLGDRLFLHGANMAIKKSAWNKVKGKVCIASGIHEDLDLAIHLQEAGLKVSYDVGLVAGVSSRRIESGFNGFRQYCLVSPRTYARHKIAARRYMYLPIGLFLLGYYPAHLLYLSKDPLTGSFSINYLLLSHWRQARIDPSINSV